MKKTFTLFLLVALVCVMILTGCDFRRTPESMQLGVTIIKKTDIREDQNMITVVYEDGYEISYSFIQPIESYKNSVGDNVARIIGSKAYNLSDSGWNSATGSGEGFIVLQPSDNVISAESIVLSPGYSYVDGNYTYVVEGTKVGSLTQYNMSTAYVTVNGTQYEDCYAEVLEKIRAKTTLLDFVTGYEETPIHIISTEGFTKFEKLEAVILPASIKKVGEKAFDGCSALTTVYFCGTQEEWADVVLVETQDTEAKQIYPNLLASCNVYFYSENEPTSAGNYWHLVDGKPTAW